MSVSHDEWRERFRSRLNRRRPAASEVAPAPNVLPPDVLAVIEAARIRKRPERRSIDAPASASMAIGRSRLAERAMREYQEMVARGSRVCNLCGIDKPLEEYNRRQRSSGLSWDTRCKACHKAKREELLREKALLDD